MQFLEVLRWIVTGILAILGGWAIIANYVIVIRWYLKKQSGSIAPLLGGVLVSLAMITFPIEGISKWWWLPFVIDLGCLASLVGFLYAVFVLKCFRK